MSLPEMATGVAGIELEAAVCPLCGGFAKSTVLSSISMDGVTNLRFGVSACAGCGLLMTDPRPAPASIGIFYEGGLYETGESTIKKLIVNPAMRRMHSLRLRQAAGARPVGRLLDVGCGKGKFLATAARRGWEAWGIEPSQRSVSQASTGGGGRLITGRFEDLELPDEYFDLVTMWHTLEHFHQPLETLMRVRKKLKDDGTLVVRVPNSDSWDLRWGGPDWFQLDVPRHLYHFSPASLGAMLVKAGFRTVSVSTVSLEDNPLATLQTLMAMLGFGQGSVFRLIKGDFGQNRHAAGRGRALLASGTAAVLLLPSVLVSKLAERAGRGGTLTMIAVKDG